MAGVLGVRRAPTCPYAFFNLLSPLISLLYGFTGFRIDAHRRRRWPAAVGAPKTAAVDRHP